MNRENKKIILRRKQATFVSRLTIFNVALTFFMVIFAGIPLYFNYFKIANDLQARMIWTEYGPEFKDDSLTVKIAVFNRGNRQGLIGRMELVRLAFRDGSISSKAWGPGQTVHPVLPLLVDPGEMVSLRLTMPYQAQDWFNHSFECDSATTPTPGTRCANLGISWGVVNSEGESFNGSAMVAFLYVEPKGVTGAATFANPIHLYVQGI